MKLHLGGEQGKDPGLALALAAIVGLRELATIGVDPQGVYLADGALELDFGPDADDHLREVVTARLEAALGRGVVLETTGEGRVRLSTKRGPGRPPAAKKGDEKAE